MVDLAKTTRQRQMLDVDQLRSSGQKSDNVTFTDLVWVDNDLFADEWFDFSEKQEESDFWSDVLEEDLLLLKS